jgi:hypothetical protein
MVPPSLMGFLDTFKNRPNLPMKRSGDGVTTNSTTALSSVLSALQEAEAIGGRRTGVRSGGDPDEDHHHHNDRAALSLLDRALKVATRSSHPTRPGVADNSVTGRVPTSALSLVEAMNRNGTASSPQDSLSDLVRKQLQRQQQQQQQGRPSHAPSLDLAVAIRNMMTGPSGLAVPPPTSTSTCSASTSSLYSGMTDAELARSRRDLLLEQLRLEEGIQTLVRERVRLEAAAMLEEERQRRQQQQQLGQQQLGRHTHWGR